MSLLQIPTLVLAVTQASKLSPNYLLLPLDSGFPRWESLDRLQKGPQTHPLRILNRLPPTNTHVEILTPLTLTRLRPVTVNVELTIFQQSLLKQDNAPTADKTVVHLT